MIDFIINFFLDLVGPMWFVFFSACICLLLISFVFNSYGGGNNDKKDI